MYGQFNPRAIPKSAGPRNGKGYLLQDNRLSGGGVLEVATATCGHCNSLVLLNPTRTRPRHHCRRCNSYCCDRPGCRAECNPTDEGITLAFANPSVQQPFVGRAPDGTILFDPRLRDKKRVH